MSYKLWRPLDSTVHASSRYADEEPPDPEIVRRSRVRWSDDADPSAAPTPTPTGYPQVANNNSTKRRRYTNDGQDQGSVDLGELEYHWVTETDVSMDDIGGMKDLKRELEMDVIKPLTTGKEKAKKLDIPLPNIVFYGPPGTGKTYIAKALATELDLPFAKLSGSDIQTKWINESATKINSLFAEAKNVAASEGGAVVFLDELDAVLKQRSKAGRAHEEDNKVVAEFLNHLQDTSDHDIIFIGATNRLEALDNAGVRAGRIDKKIFVGRPDQEAREAILQAQLSDRPNDLTDIQIESIARQLADGVVAADIESVVVDAARHSAFYREGDQIQWEDMIEVMSTE